MATPGLFISGTGTEVGKTHVAAMIVRELKAAGVKVGVYKPAASGCRREAGQLVAADAVALWEAAGRPRTLEEVCPQRFEAPLAPHLAAAAEGRRLDAKLLRSGFTAWQKQSDVVVVEGAGGLMSPLGEQEYNLDLAVDLGLPLVIVAANQLGVIHATLTTLITARSRARQLPIAGIVLNQTERRDDDVSLQSNAAELAARCDAPVLASVAYGASAFRPAVDWRTI